MISHNQVFFFFFFPLKRAIKSKKNNILGLLGLKMRWFVGSGGLCSAEAPCWKNLLIGFAFTRVGKVSFSEGRHFLARGWRSSALRPRSDWLMRR